MTTVQYDHVIQEQLFTVCGRISSYAGDDAGTGPKRDLEITACPILFRGRCDIAVSYFAIVRNALRS